jgi:putative thioredoxin
LAEPVSDVVGLADLMECRDGIPERLAPHLRAARDSLREQNLDGTLEHLVEVVMLDKRFGDELARRAAVALFRSLGQDHELTRKHQRRLSMALHS